MTALELNLLIDGDLYPSDNMGGARAVFSSWVQGRRIDAGKRREWESFPDELDLLIIHACGYKDIDDAVLNFREETRNTLKLLAGPNAWTIYKMLKAQHGK